MLLAILLLVQAAVWAMADLAARHAANHGVQAARLADASADDGQAAAAQMLAAINPNGLTDVTITADRGSESTTVTITGEALQVIPVVTIPIHVQAHAPTEPNP